jgi:hypothetical protein
LILLPKAGSNIHIASQTGTRTFLVLRSDWLTDTVIKKLVLLAVALQQDSLLHRCSYAVANIAKDKSAPLQWQLCQRGRFLSVSINYIYTYS